MTPTAALLMAMQAPLQATCLGCWCAPEASYRLLCGHVFCGGCLAQLARGSWLAPAALLPLRCCRQAVPLATLRAVLPPAELVYYRHAVLQTVEATRRRVAEGGDNNDRPLTTACEFCGQPAQLTTAEDARRLLLDCGHAYCDACEQTLRAFGGGDGRAICCRDTAAEQVAVAAAIGEEKAAVQPTAAVAPAAVGRRRPPAKAATPKPAFQGKGKRKLQLRADTAVVDLVDLVDDDDDGVDDAEGDETKTNGGPEETCRTCESPVDAATNRFRAGCGHNFCLACLQQRGLRAIKNEEQGSIGVPIRCCGQLVALDVVRPALSKRNFAKYEALVAKRAHTALPPPPPRASKRKAARVAAAAAAAAAAEAHQAKHKKARRTAGGEETKDDGDDDAGDDAPPPECVACMAHVESAKDRLKGPCGHVYCVTCLQMMAKSSLEDRALVPIRCCAQEFPIDYVRRVLTKTQMAQYERFLKEKDWRTSELKSDKEYAAMVRSINGKQCPACGVGVQKISGCDAIRCLRGHLFCFACEAAPCTCGRTRLENYGWVPPGADGAARAAAAPVVHAPRLPPLPPLPPGGGGGLMGIIANLGVAVDNLFDVRIARGLVHNNNNNDAGPKPKPRAAAKR